MLRGTLGCRTTHHFRVFSSPDSTSQQGILGLTRWLFCCPFFFSIMNCGVPDPAVIREYERLLAFFSFFHCFADGDQDDMYTHVYKHDPAVIGYKLGLILLNTSMYLLMLLLNFLSAKPRRRLQYRKSVGASVQACNKHLPSSSIRTIPYI